MITTLTKPEWTLSEDEARAEIEFLAFRLGGVAGIQGRPLTLLARARLASLARTALDCQLVDRCPVCKQRAPLAPDSTRTICLECERDEEEGR